MGLRVCMTDSRLWSCLGSRENARRVKRAGLRGLVDVARVGASLLARGWWSRGRSFFHVRGRMNSPLHGDWPGHAGFDWHWWWSACRCELARTQSLESAQIPHFTSACEQARPYTGIGLVMRVLIGTGGGARVGASLLALGWWNRGRSLFRLRGRMNSPLHGD